MSFDMNRRDDEWLDFALRQKPEIKDDGFSASLLARLETQARKRRHLLIGIVFIDLLIVAVILPWRNIFNWLTKGAMMTTKLTPNLPDQAIAIDWPSMPVLGGLIIMALAFITVFLAQEN